MASSNFPQESSKFKTREQIANEYGIHRRTLYRRLKEVGLSFSGKLLSVNDQKEIYACLGEPIDT